MWISLLCINSINYLLIINTLKTITNYSVFFLNFKKNKSSQKIKHFSSASGAICAIWPISPQGRIKCTDDILLLLMLSVILIYNYCICDVYEFCPDLNSAVNFLSSSHTSALPPRLYCMFRLPLGKQHHTWSESGV